MAPRPRPSPSAGIPPELRESLNSLGINVPQTQSGGAAQVFMGYRKQTTRTKRAYRGTGDLRVGAPLVQTRRVPDTLGIEQAANLIYSWSDSQLNDFRKKLIARGLLDPAKPVTISDLGSMWGALVEQASKFYSQGRRITPFDVLENYAGFGGVISGAAGMADPGPEPFRREDIRLTDAKTARALIRSLLQDRLGRDPSKAEYQSFISALRTEEQESPIITSGIIDDGRIIEQTQRGGVQPTAFAQDYAEDRNEGEYGAYQAATTYMDALMQAIGATA